MNAIIDPTAGKMMEYGHLVVNERTNEKLNKAATKEFGLQMNGLQQVIKGTKTMHSISANKFPKG